MKIVTSYYPMINELTDAGYVPISIAGGTPEWYLGLTYKKLAPKWSFFKEYKAGNLNEEGYIKQYNALVLDQLNLRKVLSDLEILGGTRLALLCYEKPRDFCHRHLVAEWLTRNTEMYVGEFNE